MTAVVVPVTRPDAGVSGSDPTRTPATTIPRGDLDAPRPQPRANLGQVPAESRFIVWGARFGALALAWVICERLTAAHGIGWFVVVAALANLLLLAIGTAMVDNAVAVSDRVAGWLIGSGAVVVFAALASVVIFVLKRGWSALHHVNFFTHTMNGVGPGDPLGSGGILHAMIGTLIELSIAVAITLPLGVGTAVFMTEVGGRFGKIVRTVVEAMTALPSIVAGLFIYTTWIIALGRPRSGLAAALALAVMMLPIIARASDVVLRVVPGSLREASYALGASRWKTVWNVVLPTARPGLATALILGVARGAGETSPVLITSGAANFTVTNPTHGVMNSMPLFIFSNVRSGVPVAIARGFGCAAALLVLVLVLFTIARLLARPPGAGPSLLTRITRLTRPSRPTPSAPVDQDVRPEPAPADPAFRSVPRNDPDPAPPLRSRKSSLVNPRRSRRSLCWALALLVLTAVASTGALRFAPSASAVEYAEIEGSGSTWSYVILQQWIADVASSGMQITYNNNGSSQGRKDFANSVTDFGISEIPYQGTDPTTGQTDKSSRPYAYLPIVAGGTSFTYHVEVAGQLKNNLRLSGETIARIFTGQITNWNDPAITKDNNGHALPSLTIHPVVRSDASGTTAQFTGYLAKQYPSIWAPFNGGHDALTSQFPAGQGVIKAAGSDQVMNTISSSAGNGTIGYVEYAYPLNAHYPVVKVENASGYFVEPTQYNVAVALTKAKINQDRTSQNYLTEILDGVYAAKDPRAYPLSSYSYMIIPTSSTDHRMTTAKRQTLADFLSYSLCSGQAKAGPYGYSPLPLNLVSAGFSQVAKLKQADPDVDLTNRDVTKCNNPTFVAGHLDQNHLAQIAPEPASCDKVGADPCGTPTGQNQPSTDQSNSTTSSNSTGPTSANSQAPGTGPPGTSPGSTATNPTTGKQTTTTTPGSGSSPTVDPVTGALVSNTSATTGTSGDVYANPVELSADRQGDSKTIGGLAVLELLAIVLLPGLYVAYLRRRRGGS